MFWTKWAAPLPQTEGQQRRRARGPQQEPAHSGLQWRLLRPPRPRLHPAHTQPQLLPWQTGLPVTRELLLAGAGWIGTDRSQEHQGGLSPVRETSERDQGFPVPPPSPLPRPCVCVGGGPSLCTITHLHPPSPSYHREQLLNVRTSSM